MQVRLFGEFEAEHAGVPVPIRGVKQRALLALLALHRGQPVSADRLIEVLWGDGQAAHPAAYASSYRQAPLWLSPGELAELARKCSGPAGPRRQQPRTWPSVLPAQSGSLPYRAATPA